MATNCNPCPVCPAPITGVPGSSPLDPDNPFLNLSAEAPDVDLFIGRRYTTGDPPLDSFYYAVGCVGFCLGTTQAEADLCAARQTELCTASNWPTSAVNPDYDPSDPTSPPVVHGARLVYPNQPQTFIYNCPDGTVNTYTVPAGTILSLNSLALANAEAYSLAQKIAEGRAICLSPLSNSILCLGTPATVQITATSNTPVAFAIASGSLPPGMTSDNEFDVFTISGTPTVAGDYSIILEANNTDGTSVTKSYLFQVSGISTASALPGAFTCLAYSQTLTSVNMTGPVTWSVTGGALPSWMTLGATTGTLAGTPPIGVVGTSNFTVTVTDGTATCSKNFSITTASKCPDWSLMIWGAPSIALAGNGSGSAAGSGGSFQGGAACPAWSGGPNNTATVGLFGSMTVNLPAPTSCCQVSASVFASPVSVFNTAIVDVRVNGFTVYFRGTNGGNVGTGQFSVPAGPGTVISVTVSLDVASAGGLADPKQCGATGSFLP